MNAYYLCPYESMSYMGRTVYAARVLLHLHGETHRAYRAQPARAYCLTVVADPSPVTQAAIESDGAIRTLPITSDDLATPLGILGQNAQDTLRAFLTEHTIPTGWITASTTIGEVLRFVINLHLLCQMTGVNFLQGDLTSQYRDFPATQRTAFRAAIDAYLATQGRAVDWAALGLSNTTPLGTVLTVVAQALNLAVDI